MSTVEPGISTSSARAPLPSTGSSPLPNRHFSIDGLRVRREIDHSGFARLLVDDGQDRTEVDLGSDARLFPVEEGPGFPLLSGEELAVDKLLALFGRAEARDLVDLMAVADHYGLERLLDLAAESRSGSSASAATEVPTSGPVGSLAVAYDRSQFDSRRLWPGRNGSDQRQP